jgi:hypothetical protein
MRLLACLAMAIALMNDAVVAQADDKAWSFSASAYTYVVPDDREYVQPTVTADRGWLHLEARYNYEALDTGSAWVGYNFSGGEKLAWEVTPILGGVFGDTTGIAPGYKASLGWLKLELYSEGEYVFDTGSTSDNFLLQLVGADADASRVVSVRHGDAADAGIQNRSRDPARRPRRLRLQESERDRLCFQSGRRQAHVCPRCRPDFLKSPPARW